MSNENVLYVPIQINGGGDESPAQLLDRELYVLKDGTLYVGIQEGESVKPTVVVGRVIANATIDSPTLSSPTITDALILDKSMLFAPDVSTFPENPVENQVIFVDMGQYNPPATE